MLSYLDGGAFPRPPPDGLPVELGQFPPLPCPVLPPFGALPPLPFEPPLPLPPLLLPLPMSTILSERHDADETTTARSIVVVRAPRHRGRRDVDAASGTDGGCGWGRSLQSR